MNFEKMKQRKQELGYSNARIAELSGVPLGTVQKIFSGETTSPRYTTLLALEQVLFPSKDTFSSTVHENVAPYLTKRQGEYTIEDCDKLPEDVRTELIDGVIYYMSAPTITHQSIGGYVYTQLFNHIRSKRGQCLPMIAPVDVELDCDNKTRVQPDVLIVCDRSKIINRCVYGAPDFVLEVLSPSTKKKDMLIKLNKYLNAGVREYWMIDPDKKKLMVYNLQDPQDLIPEIYNFDQTVAITVLDEPCEIDLKDMYEYIAFLYED